MHIEYWYSPLISLDSLIANEYFSEKYLCFALNAFFDVKSFIFILYYIITIVGIFYDYPIIG